MSTKRVADLLPGDVVLGVHGPIPIRGVTPARRGGRQFGWRVSGGRLAGWVTSRLDETVEVADVDPANVNAWVIRRTDIVPMTDGSRREWHGYWNGLPYSSNSDPADHTTRVYVSAQAAQAAIDGTWRAPSERRRWTPVLRADAIATRTAAA